MALGLGLGLGWGRSSSSSEAGSPKSMAVASCYSHHSTTHAHALSYQSNAPHHTTHTNAQSAQRLTIDRKKLNKSTPLLLLPPPPPAPPPFLLPTPPPPAGAVSLLSSTPLITSHTALSCRGLRGNCRKSKMGLRCLGCKSERFASIEAGDR